MAVTLTSGSVLLMGGHDADGCPLRDTWVTQDFGKSWQGVREPAWPARGFSTAVALPRGVLVFGGSGQGNAVMNDIWDSNALGSRWRQLPRPPLEARTAAALAAFRGGLLVLLGGMGEGARLLQDAWVFELVDGPASLDSPTSLPGSRTGTPREKFRVITSTEVMHVATGATPQDAGLQIIQEVMHDLSRGTLRVPDKSPLLSHMQERVADAMHQDVENDRFIGFVHDEVARSLLSLDVLKRLERSATRRGAGLYTLHVSGIARYFESRTQEAYSELLHMAQTNALATLMYSEDQVESV